MDGKKYVFTDSDLDGVGSFLVLKWLIGDLPYKTIMVKTITKTLQKPA